MKTISKIRFYILSFYLFLFLAMSGCIKSSPEKIFIGKDYCDHCHMTISDHRFGGELLTPKGKVFKFDSLECMKNYEHSHSDQGIFKKYVLDSKNPGDVIDANEAIFIKYDSLRSPMGGVGVVAISKNQFNYQEQNKSKNEVLNWEKLYSMIEIRSHHEVRK